MIWTDQPNRTVVFEVDDYGLRNNDMRRERLLHDINTHTRPLLLFEAQLASGVPGYVNYVAVFARHSVVDFDHNALVVLDVGHLHLRAERQFLMCPRQRLLIKDLTARCPSALKLVVIVYCHAFLSAGRPHSEKSKNYADRRQ